MNKIIRWMEHIVVVLSFVAIARLIKELYDVLTEDDGSGDDNANGAASGD